MVTQAGGHIPRHAEVGVLVDGAGDEAPGAEEEGGV